MGGTEIYKIEASEMWCYRRILNVKWKEKVRNEEILERMSRSKKFIKNTYQKKIRLMGHTSRHPSLLNTTEEGTRHGNNYEEKPRLK